MKRTTEDVALYVVIAAVLLTCCYFGAGRADGQEWPAAVCTDSEGHQFVAGWGAVVPPEADVVCVPGVSNPGPNDASDMADPDGVGYLPRPGAASVGGVGSDVEPGSAPGGLSEDGPTPPAADTYAVDGSSVTEVDAYLEQLYQTTMYLRVHQVGRWQAIADCESGSRWSLNGSHDGALQFAPRTWTAMGGGDFARYAYQAEPWQQAEIADRLVAYEQAHGRGGYGPWPSCARRLGLPR